ncbi:MAG: UDP-N-acetylmuramoyl-L-alanine--D-glutamate ligase [Bacteroidia bacterium]|nr:MAG: UDP-N-acetylmuramoyl-L-alanine--D-glutamate ligase [Bacteroidia bacterium]
MSNGKKICILGAGESGVGAACLAMKVGHETFLSDNGTVAPEFKEIIRQKRIPFEEGKHSLDIILNADEIIKSPGIPDDAQIVREAIRRNIPIISEIEFAARYTAGKKICITGSNGKTTTAELTFHILRQAGYDAALVGNIGNSFAARVAKNDADYYVLELSSFQLDNMYDFKADIAILLNITPDHLDRYEHDFEKYIQSKLRIMQNMDSRGAVLYCADDPVLKKYEISQRTPAAVYPFSVKNKMAAYKFDNEIVIDINENKFTMNQSLLNIKGDHNMYNSMAAGIAAKLSGISNKQLQNSFSDFKGVEHRLEKYLKIRGVQFINDSKATNVNSVWYALQTVNTPTVLILGGVDKGNDYDVLKDLVKKKVKAIVAMGIDNSLIIKAFEDIVHVYDTHSMKKAVELSYTLAEDGETVLLSPACASFDLFKNYQERGKIFKQVVRNL